MIIYDFFAGTGSSTKAFEDRGHTVISFELNPKQKATENVDILELDAAELIAKYGHPDFIWASPPCTTFSVASCPIYWHYVDGVLTPKDDRVYLGIAMVEKAIMLIDEIKPKLGYVIENPRGMLRKQPFMETLTRRTVTYCAYGDFRMKPTDLWGEVPGWTPRPICKPGADCHESSPRGSNTGNTRLSKVQRSMIPYALGEEICIALEQSM